MFGQKITQNGTQGSFDLEQFVQTIMQLLAEVESIDEQSTYLCLCYYKKQKHKYTSNNIPAFTLSTFVQVFSPVASQV